MTIEVAVHHATNGGLASLWTEMEDEGRTEERGRERESTGEDVKLGVDAMLC